MKRECIGFLWVCATLVGGRSSALAMSCVPFEDRFVLQCSGGACEVAFRAVDSPLSGCGRRLVVETDAGWAANRVRELVAARHLRDADGVVVVTVRDSWPPRVRDKAFLSTPNEDLQFTATQHSGAVGALLRHYRERARREHRATVVAFAAEVVIALVLGSIVALLFVVLVRRIQGHFAWALLCMLGTGLIMFISIPLAFAGFFSFVLVGLGAAGVLAIEVVLVPAMWIVVALRANRAKRATVA